MIKSNFTAYLVTEPTTTNGAVEESKRRNALDTDRGHTNKDRRCGYVAPDQP
jgi:hypothetical protein